MDKVEAHLRADIDTVVTNIRKIQILDMFNASLMNFLFPRKSLYNEYKLENIISRLRTV